MSGAVCLRRAAAALVALATLLVGSVSARAGRVTSPTGLQPFVIVLDVSNVTGTTAVSHAAGLAWARARRHDVEVVAAPAVERLREAEMRGRASGVRVLWVAGAITARIDPALADEIAHWPGVLRVAPDGLLGPAPPVSAPSDTPPAGTVTAAAEEVSLNPKLATYLIAVHDEHGEQIALFQGTVYRKKDSIRDVVT